MLLLLCCCCNLFFYCIFSFFAVSLLFVQVMIFVCFSRAPIVIGAMNFRNVVGCKAFKIDMLPSLLFNFQKLWKCFLFSLCFLSCFSWNKTVEIWGGGRCSIRERLSGHYMGGIVLSGCTFVFLESSFSTYTVVLV